MDSLERGRPTSDLSYIVTIVETEWLKDTKTGIQTKRDRQTDRQTDRDREWQRERERQRETERDWERERERERERNRETLIETKSVRHCHKHTWTKQYSC